MLRRAALLVLAAGCLSAWAVSSAPARVSHVGLTITVSGAGHVTGSGLSCPPDCFISVPTNDVVAMTAAPDGTETFTGWGGDCVESGTNATCQLTMNRDRTASATFGAAPPPPPTPTATLTVRKSGTGTGYVGGSGGIDCGPTCMTTLPNGTSVSLTAVADPGSRFAGWADACTGTEQCSLSVSADTSVTAVFDHEDTQPPLVSTLGASAKHGAIAVLRYRVWDDSRESREELTVVDGKVVLKRIAVPTHEVEYRTIYSVRWRVPRSLRPGRLRFCAVGVDEAGNRSRRTCSPFRVT